MTKLVILTPNERRRFDAPPTFNYDERTLYFSLNNDDMEIMQELRKPTNKVGFLLQLGYFKANGKFYIASQFMKSDVDYVAKIMGVNINEIDLSTYQKKIPSDHRKKILELMHWKPFNRVQEGKIVAHAQWLVQRQFSLKNVFLSIIDFCWQNKIELPSYNALSLIITNAFNQFEHELIITLTSKLTHYHQEKLNQLAGLVDVKNKKRMERSPITLLKQMNQSLKTTLIQENVEVFKSFKNYFYEFKPFIDELQLSDQATEYFATWVQKSTVFQLNQFHNKNKLYLHLLCYIKHQFYLRHDMLIDIFLKSVRSVVNTAKKKQTILDRENHIERNKAIKKLSGSNKRSRELIEDITNLIKSPLFTDSGKLVQIKALVDAYHLRNSEFEKTKMIHLEESLNETSSDQIYFDALESMSLKLQRRVSSIVKVLEFNIDTSIANLTAAIEHFKLTDGELNNYVPFDFLNDNEKIVLYDDDKLRVSLYKILLFIHIEDAIKSGSLNLLHSYRFKAIHEYLIDEVTWKSQRESLIKNAGLCKFMDFNNTINALKKQLEHKYKVVNERFLADENSYLTIDIQGKFKVSTPKIDSDESEYVSSLLIHSGFTPILQVLNDINQVTDYVSSFSHFSIKHIKMKPSIDVILAGILGKGCNIGINRMAKISVGITEDVLKNVVNWCFTLKNIQNANNKIMSITNKLFLSNHYRQDPKQLHTGSDGCKVNVAVDSLLANYSFKYFGKGKGVTMYIFMDERQLLFHSTVISSSEREAAYVIDGLLQNEVVKSNIHSTDTHGFSESVFATTHFIGTAFAPRLKNIGKQKLYAFSSRKTYERKGYQILPSRTINIKLIENYWDDILRFMATIKLKHTSASQLFKRLSSYAKDHPLYQAIKEFGRIIKSIFILTYCDDLALRQRIEKQLNKVELSNKFSRAVFFANNQEFKLGDPEDQKIATACKVLIQNAIILWNYLYLSQLLVNNVNHEERMHMIESIRRGSMIVWHHINLQGEYDFTKNALNDDRFNMEKILELKAA